VSDLDRPTYQEACALLESQQSALLRYGQIVAAQSDAAAAGDIDRVAGLAVQVDGVIAELAASGRRVAPVQRRLQSTEVAGPHAEAVRTRMRVVADLAAATESAAHTLVTALTRRRDGVKQQLEMLDASAAAASRYTASTPGPRSAFVRVI